MRLAYHIEVSKKAYILLFITAILHLFSIVFKQLVIQQVHTMRSLDQNISLSTIKIQNLRSSNETINDLNLIYYLNSVNFFYDINTYSTNLVRLNSNNEDFPKKKINEAKDYYFNKLQSLYIRNHLYHYDNLYLLQDLFEKDEFFKSTDAYKKLKPFYEDIKENIMQEEKTNLLLNYNKNSSSENENKKNYEIYKKTYKHYLDFSEEVEDFYKQSNDYLHKDFLRQFLKQYSLIEKHSDTKNLKNYYLILSILFQILGLTFLLLLFKELIIIFNLRKVK